MKITLLFSMSKTLVNKRLKYKTNMQNFNFNFVTQYHNFFFLDTNQEKSFDKDSILQFVLQKCWHIISTSPNALIYNSALFLYTEIFFCYQILSYLQWSLQQKQDQYISQDAKVKYLAIKYQMHLFF